MKSIQRLLLAAALSSGLAITAFAGPPKPAEFTASVTQSGNIATITFSLMGDDNGDGSFTIPLYMGEVHAHLGGVQVTSNPNSTPQNFVAVNQNGQYVVTIDLTTLPAGCTELTGNSRQCTVLGVLYAEAQLRGGITLCNPNSAAPADTTPPIITAASSPIVECDGSGNSGALNTWLATHGGASATDNVTPVADLAWSNNFSALSDGCGLTGSATVTFTVTDKAGNSATTQGTFTIVDTTKPTLSGSVHDILPSEAPITFTFTGTDSCGNAAVSISGVTGTAVNGAGKTISKTVAYSTSGGSFTLLQSPGVGTTVSFTATATDECGNTTTQVYSFTVLRPANEGVGNGVDGNTPGHDNNGGNDDATNKPGSPGAKKK